MRVNSIHSKFSRLVPFIRASPSCYAVSFICFFFHHFFPRARDVRISAQTAVRDPPLFSLLGSRSDCLRAFRSRQTPRVIPLRISVFSFRIFIPCSSCFPSTAHPLPRQIFLFFFQKYASTQTVNTLLHLQRVICNNSRI